MKEKLLSSDKKSEIVILAEKYGITLLILFGSQATGKTHADSDADLAFVSKRKLGPREIAECAFNLSSLVEFSQIELIDIRHASPLLLKNIAMAGIVVYEAEPQTFARFRIYAIKCFMEAQTILSLRTTSLNAFLSKKIL